MQHSTVSGLLSAVRSGLGLAALPCFIAETDEEFVRCLPSTPSDGRGIWMVTHERLRHTPQIRIVLDFLAERLRRQAFLVKDQLGASA
jgi:DNA-binding transcriptional LysR family regulator